MNQYLHLQQRKPRLREVTWLAPDNTANRCRVGIWTQDCMSTPLQPCSLHVSGLAGSKGHTVFPWPCPCGDLHSFYSLDYCQRWNVCVPTKFCVEVLTLSVMVFGRVAFGGWLGHEGGIDLNTHVKAKNSGTTRLNWRCATNPGWERFGLHYLLSYLHFSTTDPPIFMWPFTWCKYCHGICSKERKCKSEV